MPRSEDRSEVRASGIDGCEPTYRNRGMTRRLLTFAFAAAFFLPGGCKPKAKEITSLQRKEAATLVSEAQFALQIRDFARAEGLYAKAAALCPDSGDYWVALGQTRVRLGQRDPARAAYKSALDCYHDSADAASTSEPWLQQVYVLALLGRLDDARAMIAKTQKKFPDDRAVRSFVENGQLEKMVADPRFKEIAP